MSKELIIEEFNYINHQNLSIKESLIESINLIKKSDYKRAKPLLDGLDAKFIEKSSLEYAIYLKYLAKVYNENGLINKAVTLSSKSIEILQIHLCELNSVLIETKLEHYLIRNHFTNNFQNVKSSILKCLINSILINDKRLIVSSYSCLGHAYKTYGQYKMNQYYSSKSYKLFKKYKLSDYNFERELLLNIFQALPQNKLYSHYYTKKKLKDLEKLLLPQKDYIHLGLAHYQIAFNKLNFMEYNKVIENLDKAVHYYSMFEDENKMMAYCNLLRWQVLNRMGRVAFSDRFLTKSLELMLSTYGKVNFEWILFYHEIIYGYIYLHDKANVLKYTKLASQILNQYNNNPSPIKTMNFLICLIGMVEVEGQIDELKEYYDNFTLCHRFIYGENSELTNGLELIFFAKGTWKDLNLLRNSQTI